MLDKSLENIYDTYSKMLFGIAMQIAATEQDAEEILIITFKKIYKQNIIQQIYPSICITLIKLLIQTAHEQLNPEELEHNFKLKQFENTPLLHNLLCKQVSFEGHCNATNLSLAMGRKKLREEFNLLRKINIKEAQTI